MHMHPTMLAKAKVKPFNVCKTAQSHKNIFGENIDSLSENINKIKKKHPNQQTQHEFSKCERKINGTHVAFAGWGVAS